MPKRDDAPIVAETTVQAIGKYGRALGIPAAIWRQFGLELGDTAKIAVTTRGAGSRKTIEIVYKLKAREVSQ